MPKASKAAAANEDLPPGWEAREHQGKIVYINHATRTTQWKKPKAKKSKGKPPGSPWSSNSSTPMPAANPNVEDAEKESRPRNPGNVKMPTGRNTSTPASALEPLPSGWESKVIKGNVVYIDHVNKITTYDRPVVSPTSKPPPAVGANRPSGGDRRVENLAMERPLSGSSSGSRTSKMKNAGDSIGSGRVRQSSRPATGSGVGAVRRAPNVVTSPLPEGWTRSVTGEGEVYYVNHVKKTTTWTRPLWKDEDEEPTYTGNPAEPESSARSSKGRRGYFDDPLEPPLPPGWEARMFEEGRVFYINHNDETTHWERPDPPADYRPNVAVVKEAQPSVAATHGSRLAPNYTPMAYEEEEEEEEEEHFGVNEGRMESERRANAVPYEPVNETHQRESELPADTAMMPEPPLGTYEDTLAKAEASVSAALLSGRHSDRAPSTTVADSNDIQAEASRALTPAVSEPARDLEPRPDEICSVASIPKEIKPNSVSPREESPNHVSGGTGSVSAISQSGVFGPTVKRPVAAGENGRYAGSNGLGKTSMTASPPADAGGDEKSVATGASQGDDDELPEGWIALKTSDGRVYYQNSTLRCTQWERPKREVSPDTDIHKTDAMTQMETTTYDASESGRGTAVEAGWEKVVTADGKPYYQNVITRITSWDPPVGWKEPSPSVETTEDVHEETAKALSGGKGEKTDDGPEATAFQMENSREDLSAGPQDPQDPPLPPGWEKLYTDDGVPFWTNHNDQTTSWDPPPGIPSESIDASQTSPKDTRYAETEDSSVEASSRPVSGSNFPRCFDANGRKLPEGWEMLTTDQGVVYYVDHINKRTCWDPPQMSSGGQSVLDTGLPDIPPAELVPDSADLYTGADLLNRFFESWSGDARGRSPLEAARNVIVTLLAGPGLRAMKSRNRSSVSRFLYFGPDNKQIVWATKASSKGKYSKKGMTLESIIELQSEDGGIKIEMRGEEPLTLKSEAVEPLTSEGASILLGVLLADMTGSVLRLAGVNGGNPCSYYPASFVEKVLKVRQARQEKKSASQDVLKQSSEASMGDRAEARPNPISASNGGPSPSKSSNLKELAQADNSRVGTTVVHPKNNGDTNKAVGKGAEFDAQAAEDAGDTEQDQEEEEYRRVLDELLRPVKLERHVDDFVASEITLDILPLVERSDLENVVGIESAVSQLKIIRQIKKRFPNGVL